MIFADVLSAELVCFGDFGHRMSTRGYPGGEECWDDMAQSWIDGRVDEVLSYARAHEEKVRARCVAVNAAPLTSREKIRELRKQGWSTTRIAKALTVSAAYIVRVCRDLPAPPKTWKTDTERVRLLRSEGWSQRAIATELGLSPRTVHRVLKAGTSPYYGRNRTTKQPSSECATS